MEPCPGTQRTHKTNTHTSSVPPTHQLRTVEAKREAALEATRLEEERQRASERHKYMEDERTWRRNADADAARQVEEESNDPALARAREEARAAAVAQSAAAVAGGWRSKIGGRAKAREEQRRVRQAELAVEVEKQAEQRRLEEAEAAVRRAAEEAEAAVRRAAAEEVRREREEDERGRLEYERIMRGEATPRGEEGGEEGRGRGGGGSTPRLPSLQPRRPSEGQGPKRSAASPRKTPRGVGSQAPAGRPTRPPESALHSEEHSAAAVSDGGLVAATAASATVEAGVVVVVDAPAVDPPARVHIEDCEANPRDVDVLAGTALTFAVSADEPEHFEYGFEVRRLEAGADGGREEEEEGELLFKSETICAGESWVCTLDAEGIYVISDPDFSPDCDVRVRVRVSVES